MVALLEPSELHGKVKRVTRTTWLAIHNIEFIKLLITWHSLVLIRG